MRLKFTLLFFFMSWFSFGQTKEIDSLKKELKRVKTDSERLKVLTNIFETYLFINLDSANVYRNEIISIPKKNKKELITDYGHSSKYFYYKYDLDSSLCYAEKSLKIAVELKDQKLQSDFYRKMAILSSRKFDYEKATQYGKLALKTAKLAGDWEHIASASTMLGNQYFKRNDFDLAIKFYLTADSIYKANKYEDRNTALLYDNLASIYIELKESKALLYIKKGRNLYEKLQDLEGLNYNNTLKGTYYQAVGDYKNAVVNFEKALDFYINYGSAYRLNEVYGRLINCYSQIGSANKASSYLLKSEVLIKNLNDKSNLLELYMNAGQYFLDQKIYNQAIIYLNKANLIIHENNVDFSLTSKREISKGLSNAYYNTKDYKNAFEFSQISLNINDSIYKKNNLEISKELETKYQTEKKEQEIALLKSEKEVAAQKQKNQHNLLLGGLGITSIAGLFLFVLYRNRHKTNTKLKELDILKSNFFANISHEFRTPLTLISSPIDDILTDDSISNKKREQFTVAKQNSERLLSLVNQLLDLSKIDAGQLKLHLQEGNVLQLISALSQSFTYSATQKNINLNLNIKQSDENVWFDKDAVEKITVNLLSNALKYTPENGSVVCQASVENNKLVLQVNNTGTGLTYEESNHIFDRFYQTNEQNQGTGIGLALVKELVELHKGTISVTSTKNEWTTFNVMLSIDKNSFKNATILGTDDTDSKIEAPIISSTIFEDDNEFVDSELPILLIVEDNNDLRHLLKQTFEENYNVISAPNGKLGVELALEHIPDLIISDIMMPEKDGVELTNALKNDERSAHIPIILLTAKADVESKFTGIDTGADDYITKPFDKKLLVLKVEKLIESRRKLQSRYSQEIILKPKDIAFTNLDEIFLNKVQIVLDNQLVESSFNVEDFSKAVGMSRMQLHRKIKALTGLSASEFIRSQRLKLAAQLLKNSDINISQVGYSVGFNDHAYFSKCFKDIYKCTPTEYAKKS
ncbi:response regulator [Yeosuana marina]|uniref:response regulator n=1 Tax=Yeosuana marina TaxID=1565536 RepID=UPI0030C84C5B